MTPDIGTPNQHQSSLLIYNYKKQEMMTIVLYAQWALAVREQPAQY